MIFYIYSNIHTTLLFIHLYIYIFIVFKKKDEKFSI